MSPRRTVAEQGTGGKVALGTILVLLIAVGMMLLVRAAPEAQPFDPRSDAASGTRGLVVLLERFGAEVDVVRNVPGTTDSRVLVLQDRLSAAQRVDLQRFVDRGGVAVVADPSSPFANGPGLDDIGSAPLLGNGDVDSEANVLPGICDVAAVAHLRGLYVTDGVRLPVDGRPSCFGDGDAAFLVVHSSDSGAVVALGDNELFTNQYLRFADNAGLATALLAPTEGSKVSIVLGAEAPATSADIGTGDRQLLDLVRPGVWMALTQLVVAFAVFAVSRAVRPGRPVREPEQVPIAGSELVVATGQLMQRAKHAQRAGWLLRGELHRDLCSRLRLPATTSIVALDEAVAARTELPPGRVAAVLQTEALDDRQLLDLSNRIQEIRDLVLEGATT